MSKQKRCKVCRALFDQFNSLQKVCSPKCALELVKRDKDKAWAKEKKKRKEALKTKSEWMEDAQKYCNEYIRLRDRGDNCISCDRPPKKKNAGHYRSVGAQIALRYHPDNIHLQCEHCNSWKSGNATEYRINLVKKIGVEVVEWLEQDHPPQNWTIEDIKEIKEYYKELIKELK